MTQLEKLITTLCLFILLANLSTISHAEQSRAIKKDYPFTKLSDRVYVIYGPMGEPTKENQGYRNNVTIVITKKGVVVIDPGTSVYVGEMVLKKIRSITDQPVVAVFNTHIHGDHWLGNQAFKDANPAVNIYAHINMKKLADSGEGDSWIKRFNDATDNAVVGTKPVAPNKIVKDGDVIKIGELNFKIHHTGPAHSDGDIMVEIIEEQTLLTGDIVRVGLVGISNASFKGNLTAMDRALETKSRLFIPGHGKVNDAKIVKDYRRFIRLLRETVAKYYEEGLSDYDIKPKVVQALFDYKDWKLFEENLGRLVSLTYLEVEAEAFQ